MMFCNGWKESFSVILGSYQVKSGKPAPYLFEEAATKLGVDAVNCLVMEDSSQVSQSLSKALYDSFAILLFLSLQGCQPYDKLAVNSYLHSPSSLFLFVVLSLSLPLLSLSITRSFLNV